MQSAPSLIQAQLPLGRGPWRTFDPFLFCVHHQDQYPAGDAELAPRADLRGRNIGSDFSHRDGWSMYHGRSVPGFPQHPHRGFETISIVRRGLIDHSDSLGATARIGAGDVQWMTAGAGIVHAEMFPLVHQTRENPTDFFQIWLNLPAARKMTPPQFKMFWREQVPLVKRVDQAGKESIVTVISGVFAGHRPPDPPVASWAADPQSDLSIWLVEMPEGAEVKLPKQPRGTHRVIYHVEGGQVEINGALLSPQHGALMLDGYEHHLRTPSISPMTPIPSNASGSPKVSIGPTTTLLVLQGRPIGEPVAQRGPFVMNTIDELRQAVYDYQTTQFGGWPWPRVDPVHRPKEGRFARYIDGSEHRPPHQ